MPISASAAAPNGVSGAGFKTIEHPLKSAGMIFLISLRTGTFHGTIAATTPIGRRSISVSPVASRRRYSNFNRRAMSIYISISSTDAPRSRDEENGMPIDEVLNPPSSSVRSAIRSRIRLHDRDPLL